MGKVVLRTLAIPLALLLDYTLGDLPNRWHPVAWMGSEISWFRKNAPTGDRARFAWGALIALGGMVDWALLGELLHWFARTLPMPIGVLVEATVLKQTVGARGLEHAGRAVQLPLEADDLPEARRQLSWHLVSRPTATLDERQIAAAAVESLAENASDGVIAPLFWYSVGGLPAALAYRYLNTCDSILGYRDAEREWLGKASARLDDLANLVPARLTAGLIVGTAPLYQGNLLEGWRVWRRDASKTASPNAGHPMAAAAGTLEIALDKKDHYLLGAEGRPARADDIGQAVNLVRWSAAIGVIAMILFSWIWGALGSHNSKKGKRQ